MRIVGILALNTLKEQWRNRAYQITLVFAGVMLYLSVLLGMLAVDQELRALLDFGLAFIELTAFAGAVFGAATGILREMETKAIYLVLSRPITRGQYLLGRTCGLALSMLLAVTAMAVVHLTILLPKGWPWDAGYLLALGGILLKVSLATALATLLALISTSALSALTITGIFWTLGHFTQELRFLLQHTKGSLTALPMHVVVRILPDLHLFNFRDRLDVPAGVFPGEAVGFAALYALVYSTACLAFARHLMRRRDF